MTRDLNLFCLPGSKIGKKRGATCPRVALQVTPRLASLLLEADKPHSPSSETNHPDTPSHCRQLEMTKTTLASPRSVILTVVCSSLCEIYIVESELQRSTRVGRLRPTMHRIDPSPWHSICMQHGCFPRLPDVAPRRFHRSSSKIARFRNELQRV